MRVRYQINASGFMIVDRQEDESDLYPKITMACGSDETLPALNFIRVNSFPD